jgi:hypothetical protein
MGLSLQAVLHRTDVRRPLRQQSGHRRRCPALISWPVDSVRRVLAERVRRVGVAQPDGQREDVHDLAEPLCRVVVAAGVHHLVAARLPLSPSSDGHVVERLDDPGQFECRVRCRRFSGGLQLAGGYGLTVRTPCICEWKMQISGRCLALSAQ